MAYVELEKARELLFKFRNECIDFGVKEDTVRGILYSINELAKLPTADVEEVKHAKWEINSDGYYPYCSNCKTEPKNGVMSKYCPECGAKMGSQL